MASLIQNWKLWATCSLLNVKVRNGELQASSVKFLTFCQWQNFSSGQLLFPSLLTTHTSAEFPWSLCSIGQEWTLWDYYCAASVVLARPQLQLIELGHVFCPRMVWSWTVLVMGTNQYLLQPTKPPLYVTEEGFPEVNLAALQLPISSVNSNLNCSSHDNRNFIACKCEPS